MVLRSQGRFKNAGWGPRGHRIERTCPGHPSTHAEGAASRSRSAWRAGRGPEAEWAAARGWAARAWARAEAPAWALTVEPGRPAPGPAGGFQPGPSGRGNPQGPGGREGQRPWSWCQRMLDRRFEIAQPGRHGCMPGAKKDARSGPRARPVPVNLTRGSGPKSIGNFFVFKYTHPGGRLRIMGVQAMVHTINGMSIERVGLGGREPPSLIHL